VTNTRCSIIFKLHMLPDCVSLAYRVTYSHHSREDKLVSNLANKYTWSTIFTACIVYITYV